MPIASLGIEGNPRYAGMPAASFPSTLTALTMLVFFLHPIVRELTLGAFKG
jgi:hypothetical protein